MSVNVSGGGLEFDATINGSQFEAQINRIEQRLNGFSQNIQKTGSDIDNLFKQAAVSAASFFSIQAASNFVSSLVQVRGEFQQIEVAFTTMLRSKSASDKLMAEAVQLAAITPFTLQDVASGAKQLLAYGFAAKDVTSTLTMLGNVAAGVGAPLNDIVYLYGTLQTQGRAYTRDIIQFTTRGIPIVDQLAKQFGVTKDQVNTLVEAGKVGFPEVQKAFQALTGSGGIFFNLMQEQSKTLTGQLSNLQDAWSRMLNDLGKSKQGFFGDAISEATNLVNNYQKVLDTIQLLIFTYGAYKTALLATTVVQRLSQEIALQQALAGTELNVIQGLQAVGLRTLTAIQLTYNSAAVQGAIATAAYTAGLSAIATVIYAFATATNRATDSIKNLNDINAAATKSILDQKNKIESLKFITSDLTKSENNRLSAVTKLRDIMPDVLKQYSDQEILAGKAKSAIDKYTDSMLQNAKVAAAQSKITDLQGRLIDIDTKGYEGIPISDRISGGIKGLFNGNAYHISQDEVKKREIADYKAKIQGEIDDIQKIYKDGIDKLNTGLDDNAKTPAILKAEQFAKDLKDPISNFDKLLKEAANKSNITSIKEAIQAKIDALAPGDNQLAALKIKLKKVSEIEASYGLSSDVKSAKQDEDSLKKRQEIYQKLFDLNQQYTEKSVSDDQAKILAVYDDFKKLSTEIDNYNKDPKNKVKVNTNLSPALQGAVSNQSDINETEYIKQDIEKKKQLYSEYESYRQKLGDESAKKEYADLLLSGDSYKTYLDNISKAIPEGLLSGPLEERKKLIAKYNQDEATSENIKNAEILASALTFSQRSNIIIEKTVSDANKLRKQGKEKEAEIIELQGESELDQLNLHNQQVVESYRNLANDIEQLTVEQAITRIKEAEATANAEYAAGKISEEAYKKIIALINQASTTIKSNAIVNGLDAIASGFSTIAQSLEPLNSGLANTFNNIAQGFKVVADMQSNIEKLKTSISSYSDTKSAAGGGFLGSIAAITSIIPVAGTIISGAITGISAIVGLFSNSKQKAEQLAYAQSLQLKQTEAINKALERQLSLTKQIQGPERISAYKKNLDDITAAEKKVQDQINTKYTLTGNKGIDDEITKRNNGERGNQFLDAVIEKIQQMGASVNLTGKSLEDLQQLLDSGKLDQQTAALVQSAVDLKQQAVDTQNALNEEITGINFDSLKDSIKSVFESGKTDAKSFADAIEQSIRGAFANAFERNEIEKALQPFYDALTKDGEDGVFTDQEIADLRAMKDDISTSLAAKAAAYNKIIGPDGTDTTDQSSLTGGQIVRSLTEETGDKISGGINGILLNTNMLRQAIEKQNALMMQGINQGVQTIDLLTGIKDNTGRTANNTEALSDVKKSLASIDKKMSANNNALAANGKG